MKKLIFFITVVAIFGCKKEGESLPYTEIYGQVVSRGNNEPIDSVRVSIWDGMPDDNLLGSNTTKKQLNYDTTYTDKNGNFHIGVFPSQQGLPLGDPAVIDKTNDS